MLFCGMINIEVGPSAREISAVFKVFRRPLLSAANKVFSYVRCRERGNFRNEIMK
jgi:hypothetical protein